MNQVDAEGLNIRNEKLLFPEPGETLMEGDVLVMIGEEKLLEEFENSGADS